MAHYKHAIKRGIAMKRDTLRATLERLWKLTDLERRSCKIDLSHEPLLTLNRESVIPRKGGTG